MALARVAGGHARREHVGQPSASAACAESSAAMPPWPSAERGAEDPGPGPDEHDVPALLARPSWIAPAVVIASCSPPYAGPAVSVAGEQAALAQLRGDRSECPPGSAPPAVCT